jgi:hypothetical protein
MSGLRGIGSTGSRLLRVPADQALQPEGAIRSYHHHHQAWCLSLT